MGSYRQLLGVHAAGFYAILVLLCLAVESGAQVRGSVRGSASAFRGFNPVVQSSVRGSMATPMLTNTYYNPVQNFQRTPVQSFQGTPVQFTGGVQGGGGYAKTPYSTPVGWGQPVQTVQTVQPSAAAIIAANAACDSRWTQALMANILYYDGWQCSTRIAPDGTTQGCTLTAPMVIGVAPPITVAKGCGWLMPVFCDDTINDLAASMLKTMQTTVVDPVPAGYTLIAGVGYYKVHTELLTWFAAKLVCEGEGVNTHLAVPSTAADYDALMIYINTVVPANNGVYVGISDNAVEGTFRAVTDQPVCQLGQILFNPGEPSNGGGGGENCLQIGYSKIARMNDIGCTTPLPFVCEQILPSRLAPCRA